MSNEEPLFYLKNMKQILAILAATVILTACGIKGDLYLPQDLEAPQDSVTEIEADPLSVPQK